MAPNRLRNDQAINQSKTSGLHDVRYRGDLIDVHCDLPASQGFTAVGF